jgi:oxygen-independent coproporphyrinogen-3 oxidase
MRLPGSVRFAPPTAPPTADRVIAEIPAVPGLYLHVPFCTRLCPFCPYSKVRYRDELVAPYFAALRRELDAHREALHAPFSSVYVGGGTPTLCLDELEDVLADVAVTGERAIEVLPNHLTAPTADRLAQTGVTHVSIGAQSFDADVLHRLRRPNTVRMNRDALTVAAGRFECVDVDLMFDVAYEAPTVLLDDLRTCFEAGADQVSTYPLMRFGYTPFGAARHDRRAEHTLLRAATELAGEHGFERRSVWTFQRRDGPSYSSITRPWYVGVGAGAATYTGRTFAVNHFGLEQYQRAVARGALPTALVAELGPIQRAAYSLFWQCYTGRADLGDFRAVAGPQRLLTALVDVMRRSGWIEREGDLLRLTGRGYDRYHDLERWVTYHMIEPLWSAMTTEHETATASPGPLDLPQWRRRRPPTAGWSRRHAHEAEAAAETGPERQVDPEPGVALEQTGRVDVADHDRVEAHVHRQVAHH